MAYTTEEKIQELDYGKLKSYRTASTFDREIRFTEAYRKYASEHPYIREALCQQVQTRDIMMPIDHGDWFAGRLDRMFVGIEPDRGDTTDAAYFCQYTLLEEQLKNPDLSDKAKNDVSYLLEFWKKEATFLRCYNTFPEYVKKGMPNFDYYSTKEISYAFYGFSGSSLDYDKLCRVGLPGLKAEVQKRFYQALQNKDGDEFFLKGILIALEMVYETLIRYAEEAESKINNEPDEKIKKRYKLIGKSLRNLISRAPETFHEAIQLAWLYNNIALCRNYGRMDMYLGDFLVKDIDSGILTYDEAKEMLISLWEKINIRGDIYNNRVIIGGKGRRNEKNANRFALLAMDVQSYLNNTIPQLSLRCYKGMDVELWNKALDTIALGCTFPIIYNDDVNIPAVSKGFNVPMKVAEQYMMYGCGEYLIDHMGTGSPDAAINILKALDVTLHNGIDSFSNQKRGLALGGLEDFNTFDMLQKAFEEQLDYQMDLCVAAQSIIYKVTGQFAAFPLISALYDDCIERGKPILAGGVRYLGGTVETFGNNTAADALVAIKKLVYDQKLLTAKELLEIIGQNFEGFDKERRMMVNQVKYGNDNMEADNMALWLNTMVCNQARRQGEKYNFNPFSVVLINNGDSVLHGKCSAASPDGRKRGEPLSNGNQPGAGNDKNGITALLNSMSKLDPSLHAGVVHNLKLSRETIIKERSKVDSLFKGFFENGGTQLMITIIDRNELEKAMKEPQKYTHLIVRVGGYSERFVDLPGEIQLELIKRTLY